MLLTPKIWTVVYLDTQATLCINIIALNNKISNHVEFILKTAQAHFSFFNGLNNTHTHGFKDKA